MNFYPTGDRVLIKRSEIETTTSGGLIIPGISDKNAPTQGEIIAIGDLKKENNLISIGNIAIFTSSYEIKINEEDYVVVNVEDILGVFEK